MAELSFKLEKFEGPLDLLLYLISKHKLNINDIPIVSLLEQYMEYIDQMAEQDMEIAGEFLEMAARLIYIKTVSLLPSPEEAERLKKELEGRLVEYSLCKKAAALLGERYNGGSIFVRNPLKIEIDNTYRLLHDKNLLLETYKNANLKYFWKNETTVSSFEPIVSKKVVSVASKILYVLKKLYTFGTVKLDGIFEDMTGRSERVATFLAILELTKSGRILISDDNSEISFCGPLREKRHVLAEV